MEDKDKQGEKKWYILDRGSLSLLIVLLAAILFYVGLTNFDVIAVRVRTFMGVLTPFIAGFAIAYLLNTPMCFFERKLYQKQKHRRGLAILTVYLIALAIVVVLLNLIIPQVAQSVVDLATNMQTYLTSLNSLVQTLSEQFGLEAEALNEAIGSYQDLMTNIAAMLLVFISLVALANYITEGVIGRYTGLNDWIVKITDGKAQGLTFQFILGVITSPFMWLIGVPSQDIMLVGSLLGQKTILNEFVAYFQLQQWKDAGLFMYEKSILMSTYILCGFANISSIGILLGGLGVLAPDKRGLISRIGVPAMIGGALVSVLSATIIGMILG